MITLIMKFATCDFGMESSCVDSISKLVFADSKLKSLKSTPTDYRVESSIGYSTPKLFLADSKLEFIIESKFPITLLKRCLSMELQFFGGLFIEIH